MNHVNLVVGTWITITSDSLSHYNGTSFIHKHFRVMAVDEEYAVVRRYDYIKTPGFGWNWPIYLPDFEYKLASKELIEVLIGKEEEPAACPIQST